jgi:hypothetical protein
MYGSLYRQTDNVSPLSIWFFSMFEGFVILFFLLCIAQIILRSILLILNFKIWFRFVICSSNFVQDFKFLFALCV